MSRNAPHPAEKLDRRVRRTRERLGDALVALILEKPFDTITVQHVLDRAGIGRSTFYAHYRDKDDLFLSDVDEFFLGMATGLSRHGDTSERVAPVRELFAHVADARPFYEALVESGRIHDVLELGHEHFARGIEERLRARSGVDPTTEEGHAGVAHAAAGALFSLLSWWIDRGMPTSPERMDELFHRMGWGGSVAGRAAGMRP
jgi:AcrR family transcriptional regulator